MLAPPPGGSFEIEDTKNLPIKNPPKTNTNTNNPPEEVPLLTHEPESIDQDTPKDGKVRILTIYLLFSLIHMMILISDMSWFCFFYTDKTIHEVSV